jgi:hypothetical protein
MASGNAAASGAFNSGFGTLAAAGSAAANAAGAISVSPGMVVQDARGRTIGEVEELRTRANGVVDQVIVEVRDREVALPADNFSVSGDALVSAMSRSEVRKEAKRQDGAS